MVSNPFSSLNKFLSVLLLSLMPGIGLMAQLDPANLKQYTENDGLPSGMVSNLVVDKMGFIWTGTSNGLARFDGYNFKRFYYNPNDSASIHGQVIWSLLEDRKGLIWVGASPSWLNAFDPSTRQFRHYQFKHLINNPSKTEPNVRAICQDKKGRLYFGVQTYFGDRITQGLLYKDEGDDSIKLFKAKGDTALFNILRLVSDSTGNVWVYCYGGIFKIDKNRELTSIANSEIRSQLEENDYPDDLKFDKRGHLWVITSNSVLIERDPATGNITYHRFKELQKNNVYGTPKTLFFDNNNDLWIGTNVGLCLLDKQNNKIIKFDTDPKKLGSLPVIEVVVDDFGNIWAATFNGGVLKYEHKIRLKSYSYSETDKNSLTGGWANKIREDANGKLWIATSGSERNSGINILDPRTGKLISRPFNTLFKDGKTRVSGILSLWEQSPGLMYLHTFKSGGGISYYSMTEGDKFLKLLDLPYLQDSVASTYHFIDSKQNEWLCTERGLYLRKNGSARSVLFDLGTMEGSTSSSNQVSRVVESSRHGMWIITDNGLFLYDKTGKILRYGYDRSKGDVFVTQDVNALYEAPDGTLWVGTWQGGLSHFDLSTKKIKTYTRDDGLPSMSIQSIIPDEKNNTLWLATFEGLSRLDLQSGQFNNFSLSDGIQSLMFADGSYVKTSTGLFVFGGSNGVTVFDPNEVNKSSIPPKVYITDLKLFNKSVLPGTGSILQKPIYETDSIELPHDQNNLSLEFIALHFSNPSKNRYTFKLDNYDTEWRETGDLHTAYYPGLAPGKYTFHVKAANDKGVWNEKGAVLFITVNPPWWRTTWAYLLYGLLFLLSAFGVDRYFRYRIVEKEREKNRTRELEQAKEIQKAYRNLEEAHEVLKSTQKQLVQSEKMASLGELTAGIAHEIQNPLNFVNNFSDVNGELSNELLAAAEKGDLDEVKQLALNIRDNEEKIKHHGERADSIVKSMLQHSRVSTGQKELIDINQLVEEYLNLSYHGIRARDKNFNTSLERQYDETAGKINIIPQEMGRVVLNLLNNAFYAVDEKKKKLGDSFMPQVSVSTKVESGKGPRTLIISVSDNGSGVSEQNREKILQPFFTTKPTGQGTGLGLSLSYDIVKSHGGDLTIESREGEGATFSIQLPYTT
jgi:signal transduction histidine kinase/ligand-binding sensor domain-containing protein